MNIDPSYNGEINNSINMERTSTGNALAFNAEDDEPKGLIILEEQIYYILESSSDYNEADPDLY